MKHAALFAAVLALAACTPKDEPLDGGPKAEEPKIAAPKPDDGSLAGGAPTPDALYPGAIGLIPPAGSHVVKDCEKTVSPTYDHPPAMTCLYLLGDGPAPTPDKPVTEGALVEAMIAASWQLVRTDGAQRYFERPKPGTDCADAAVMVVLSPDQAAALLKSTSAAEAPKGKAWRAYGLLASTREACGADRMGK